VAEAKTFRPWTKTQLPKRILAIRLQCLGDTFIALSYLQYLRQVLPPQTKIDFLGREEYYDLPSNLILFDEVFSLKGGNKRRNQLFGILPHFFKFRSNNYDVVLDLQNNEVSNIVRRIINPDCYVRFDRFSENHACVRNINTINNSGFIKVKEGSGYSFKNPERGKNILKENDWKGEQLILLNPAGAFSNRNWPVQNYISLAEQLTQLYGSSIKFLVLGTDKILDKAAEIKNKLSEQVIVLINKTSITDAFAIMQEITLSVTEDGGLMHMSYLSGKKTIGLIGSSRSDWTNPKMPHTFFFTSDDLECGNCMLANCKYGTDACMTRISPRQVLEKALIFLPKTTAND
jgi:ADP-heptose:LPS heptosyltransferase